jgi:hypothetical protein
MKKDNAIEKYILLFLPWAISLLFEPSPIASYLLHG